MLFSNDIFMLDGVRMRLLYSDSRTNVGWSIDLDDELAWPLALPYDEICNLERLPQTTAQANTPSKARLQRCEEAWSRLKPLIDDKNLNLFAPSDRNYAIEAHAEKTGCSARTVHKDLRRYWQRGQTKFALIPDFHKSGRPLVAENEQSALVPITAGRGRKPKQGHDVYQLTSEDAKRIKAVIEKEYLKNQQISVVDAHASLVNQHYRFADGNQDLHVNPAGSLPSLRQFRRFLHKNFDIETRVRGRVGDSDYEREHRKVLGSIMADCLGVGHFYEIDATIVDAYVVSKEDVNEIIGKPTLYLIIDRKSRLIVGFYLGLENASWTGALQAILSISEDKSELCARYGVQYNPDDWPAHQVFPQEFLADRGDMISRASTNIAENLQVTVTNLPSKRPDWKPLVECGFRLIHNSLRPITPAYDPPSNATRRRGKHYEKDACLTMDGMGNLILNTIIAHNRREILNYDMTPKELLEGVRPAPIALWNHGIVSRAGVLTRYEEATVRFALLRKKQATVTERGIEFEGCFYSFPEAIAQKWFETARRRRFNVTVSYDTRLVDSIYVHPLSGYGEPYVATITERSEKYRGKCFQEVAYYETMRATVRKESEHFRLQNRIDLANTTKPVVDAAKKRLKTEGSNKSRSSRKADTKEMRTVELALERKALAHIDGGKAHQLPMSIPVLTPQTGQPLAAVISVAPNDNLVMPQSMADRVAAARARMRA